MAQLQSRYFDIKEHQFPAHKIFQPLPSQLLEMSDLENSLDLPKGSSLLDFGCGSGRLSMHFLSRGFSVLAVDISGKSLIELVNNYKQKRQPHWGKLTISTYLPNRRAYDGIVGSDILHHVNLKEVIPGIYRVLKPGGKIAFSEPNALNIFWYLYYLIYRLPWSIESGILQITTKNIRSLLKESTFKNIQIRGHGIFPTRIFNFSPLLCRLNCLALANNFLFRPFAYRLIITAQK